VIRWVNELMTYDLQVNITAGTKLIVVDHISHSNEKGYVERITRISTPACTGTYEYRRKVSLSQKSCFSKPLVSLSCYLSPIYIELHSNT